ncbi:MAG: hypothetical protein EOP84_36715, partial [Verrucomicrobiaceae bacterium]
MRTVVIFALAVLSSSVAARSELIAYEGFDYTAGDSLTGKAGGINWGGAWTATANGSTVQTPGLTYTDAAFQTLQSIGNSGAFAGGGNGNLRLASLSPDGVGSTLYVSFIARMDAALANSYAGFSLFNGGTETMFLGDPNGPLNWGIDPKVGTVTTGTTSVSTQAFLVYRIDFLSGSAEIRLFENPLLSTEPALDAAVAFA